ncbi:MAG: hypothetical protein CM15mP120_10270 [Pseudomonadota bacterium]|nr:MAG: hypothetical protein CM15mP120_10270 [Pseudomonadota bacterium]
MNQVFVDPPPLAIFLNAFLVPASVRHRHLRPSKIRPPPFAAIGKSLPNRELKVQAQNPQIPIRPFVFIVFNKIQNYPPKAVLMSG